jgi:glycerate 2-kinase
LRPAAIASARYQEVALRDKLNLLHQLFQAAVAAADPSLCVPANLPSPPKGRTIVVGAGKASAAMARAFEQHWQAPLEGLVVTRYDHAVACERIRIVEASHPVPDEAGAAAARQMLELVSHLSDDDLVVCLISGGGSSLLSLPAAPLSLAEKQVLNKTLLRSGAAISEMNCVRKHLSAIKGGRLALAAQPAKVVTLVISDIPGDDPSVVASGPTLPDASIAPQALDILRRYNITVSPAVLNYLSDPKNETAKKDHPAFRSHSVRLIATPMQSLRAAAAVGAQAGYRPLILSDAIEGEAREVGIVHAGIIRSILVHGEPVPRPALLLSGGETSVTMRGAGVGGRNSEFLLSLGLRLDGFDRFAAIACDTDGIDGAADNAGACLFPDSLSRIKAAGKNPRDLLDGNDAYTAFRLAGDLVMSGPTLTNVNDFRAILIDRDS